VYGATQGNQIYDLKALGTKQNTQAQASRYARFFDSPFSSKPGARPLTDYAANSLAPVEVSGNRTHLLSQSENTPAEFNYYTFDADVPKTPEVSTKPQLSVPNAPPSSTSTPPVASLPSTTSSNTLEGTNAISPSSVDSAGGSLAQKASTLVSKVSPVAKEIATGLSEVAAGAGKLLTIYGALKVGNDVTTGLRNAGSPLVTSALYGAVATTLSIAAGAVDDAALLTPVGPVVLESWSNYGAGSAQRAVGEALLGLGMLGLNVDKSLGLK
jgi:hypothetical protein